jgi:prefoldin subunit 5
MVEIVPDYSTATKSLAAQAELVARDLAEVRRAVAKLQTSTAALEVLKSASLEPKELGRQRLIAATAEMYGIRPDQVDG